MRSKTVFTLGALALALGGLGAAGGCTAQNLGWLPPDGAGAAGASGQGGAGGTAGQPVMGTGGAGTGGSNGSGGNATCGGDEACTEAGSLCVTNACTRPTTSCAKATLIVVPDTAFAGAIDAAFATACHYRALGPALAAASANGNATTRVVAYAAAVAGPAVVPGGVRLEGRPTAPATLVALTGGGASGAGGGAGAAGAGGAGATPALVTLGDKAVLAGFALDAAGAVGVRVAAGKASLEGPLELKGGAPALTIEGSAVASMNGTAAAKILFTQNTRGIVVGETAGLTMTGEGGAGLVVEKTSTGAALLVEKGGFTPPVEIKGAVFRESKSGGGPNGAGAIEVRRNRQVLIEECTFVQNQQSVTLNAESTNSANLFLNVKISGNDFSAALPAPGQGAAVCGSRFVTAGTEIHLEPLANTFPISAAVCANIAPADGCTEGVDVGFDVGGTTPTIDCP